MIEAVGAVSGSGIFPTDQVRWWTDFARAGQTQRAFATADSANASATRSSAAADLLAEITLNRLKEAAARVERERAARLATGAGAVGGGASYTYAIGSDGRLYATGVSVTYDTTPVADDPQATILKMRQIRAAALASSAPSAADLAAAATATRLELQARLELAREAAGLYPDMSDNEAGGTGLLLDALA